VLKAAPPAGAVKNPDTFIMATIGEPQTLDPAIDYESAGGEILMNVYENLIWFNGASAVDLVPILALAVPTIANGLISADGMNYSFQLRQGVKFHDGTNMTADDVIYSIQRLCALFTPRTPAWMMEQVLDYNVGNAMYRGYNITKWEARFGPVPAYLKVGLPTSGAHVLTAADVRTVVANAVTSNSTYNVTFRLTMPYPAFLQILSYTDANIVSKDYVVANGDAYMKTHTCGTGPYKLVSWEKNSAIRLVRNDDYWRTPAKIKNVVILKIEDVNSRQLMLKAGDADSAYIPIQFQDQFADTSQFRIKKGLPTFQIDFIGFNQLINVSELKGLYGSGVVSGIPIQTVSGSEYSDFFADIHVRKAFAMAINYTQYIASAFLGNAQQINGPIPDGMFGYNASIPKMPYDWAAAKDNLSKGVVDWIANGFKIPMFYNAGNSYREAAMNMFKDSIESMSPGKITLDIKPVDWAVYMDISSEVPCPYPMICVGWQIDYADPDDFVLPFMNSGYCFAPPQNYVNLTVDALIAEAASETNLTKRAELYTNITWAAYYDVPYVWLIQAKNFHVERSWVQGYYYNPMYSGFYYYSFDK
jgi:peptide/nickel transport system substrate-binding protein